MPSAAPMNERIARRAPIAPRRAKRGPGKAAITAARTPGRRQLPLPGTLASYLAFDFFTSTLACLSVVVRRVFEDLLCAFVRDRLDSNSHYSHLLPELLYHHCNYDGDYLR
jgi:hypothetical protein